MSSVIVTEPGSAAFAQPHRVSGEGWNAVIYDDEIILSVTPEGDVLPKALNRLFSPLQLRYWTFVWSHEDLAGWDVYSLTRGTPAATKLV